MRPKILLFYVNETDSGFVSEQKEELLIKFFCCLVCNETAILDDVIRSRSIDKDVTQHFLFFYDSLNLQYLYSIQLTI